MTGLALERAAIASTVERAVEGDELAFARIVGAYHLDLVRVAYVICGDEGLAEDAAQAAWWIAWRKLPTLRDHDRVKPWLVAVAANEALPVGRDPRGVGAGARRPLRLRLAAGLSRTRRGGNRR